MSDAPDVSPLHILPVSRVPPASAEDTGFLIDRLWTSQAVGVIGGAPKCCKSWLALDMALAVASGRPCLGAFKPLQTGPVLLFSAEESPQKVRRRLEGLARVRDVDFASLPIHLILDPQLRLDIQRDFLRLLNAVDSLRPRLLILDPFVRLHRIDENSAADVSALLADLRSLQRRFALAILLVHHTRKANGEASGVALRGSSDLHAWGDSNLYLRRQGLDLVLSSEHRSAKPDGPFSIRLDDSSDSPRLALAGPYVPPQPPDLAARILALLRSRGKPVTQEEIREALKVRNQRLTEVLTVLRASARVAHGPGGWFIPPTPPLACPAPR